MNWPKIVYNGVTLQFSDPPAHVTPFSMETVRHINVASSGVTEEIYERTDEFLKFDMVRIPQSDMAGWKDFLSWANQGLSFDYYPDADDAAFTTYTMENMNIEPTRRTVGTWQLTGLKFRQVVTA